MITAEISIAIRTSDSRFQLEELEDFCDRIRTILGEEVSSVTVDMDNTGLYWTGPHQKH